MSLTSQPSLWDPKLFIDVPIPISSDTSRSIPIKTSPTYYPLQQSSTTPTMVTTEIAPQSPKPTLPYQSNSTWHNYPTRMFNTCNDNHQRPPGVSTNLFPLIYNFLFQIYLVSVHSLLYLTIPVFQEIMNPILVFFNYKLVIELQLKHYECYMPRYIYIPCTLKTIWVRHNRT